MKNLIIAFGLVVILGAGFYYFKSSNTQHQQIEHSHEGEEPHSH